VEINTLTFTPCWWWKAIHPVVYTLLVDSGKENILTTILLVLEKCVKLLANAGKKNSPASTFSQYSSESVRHRYSGVRVSPVPLVSD
jgi:hypothetical protein